MSGREDEQERLHGRMRLAYMGEEFKEHLEVGWVKGEKEDMVLPRGLNY